MCSPCRSTKRRVVALAGFFTRSIYYKFLTFISRRVSKQSSMCTDTTLLNTSEVVLTFSVSKCCCPKLHFYLMFFPEFAFLLLLKVFGTFNTAGLRIIKKYIYITGNPPATTCTSTSSHINFAQNI